MSGSDRRTAIVKRDEPGPIHEKPNPASRVAYLAEHGVVGRIGKCSAGWCRIKIGKRQGHIRASDIWGITDGEHVD